MTRTERKHQLQEAYRNSTYHDAEILLWALKVVDTHEPGTWAQVIPEMGGPSTRRVEVTLRRYRVVGV